MKVMSKAVRPAPPKAPVSFRKNVLPPILGLLMALSVFGLLNVQWIVAQLQYRFVHPVSAQATISTQSPDPTAPPAITIPKINVKAPIIADEPSTDDAKVQLAVRKGVLHYGSTATPGQRGNVVIVGHSSGAVWRPGAYKFVFTLLDKLQPEDKIIIDYNGTRYIYEVTEKYVIEPTDVSVLKQSDEPLLTLITCTPVGTNKHRLVVQAKQISPKAETAEPAADTTTTASRLPQ
jgi:sortase A